VSSNVRFGVGAFPDGTVGDGIKGIYLFGFQIELGTVATSYIPTVGSQVTRPADFITRLNAQNLIGQTEGAVLLKGAQLRRGRLLNLNNNNNNSVSDGIFIFIVGGTRCEFTVTKNDVRISSASISFPNNQPKKNILIKYSPTNVQFYINGVLFFNHDYATPTNFNQVLNKITLGSITEVSNANIESLTLFKTALTDEQAINLTKL
jgi:hypothetical protein